MEEIKLAENLFNNEMSYLEIAQRLNRSEWAVSYLLRNMGYSYRMKHFWSGDELKFLRENYKDMTYGEIGMILGRTEKAIGAKVEELGYQKRLLPGKNRKGYKKNISNRYVFLYL